MSILTPPVSIILGPYRSFPRILQGTVLKANGTVSIGQRIVYRSRQFTNQNSTHSLVTSSASRAKSSKSPGNDLFDTIEGIGKDTLIFALKDISVYFRRTILSGFGALICLYGSIFVLSLTALPETSQQISPIPFLLRNREILAFSFGTFSAISFSVNKYFIWRTISQIELKSGGQRVAFKILNHIPLSRSQYLVEVPLSHVSCIQSRRDTKQPYVVIKIKGKLGSYYIDKEGFFPNPTLFDYSIGVHRKI